ncbi:hypothetical protein M5V91_26820 [Cytobacillus pseudoceanisediminis]|uniref:hypothetical protein n=1 Tax=Cytobacillus pseudoceanisediminis TaxID=3051614 RepID=UPI00218ABA4B|nr:hypothetical protein [Cytobacillus pseudoceanisediminis]UQX54165.1 hypothetical protein M5V91_26820 [Cytobacillus pseudoceanisediminis]
MAEKVFSCWQPLFHYGSEFFLHWQVVAQTFFAAPYLRNEASFFHGLEYPPAFSAIPFLLPLTSVFQFYLQASHDYDPVYYDPVFAASYSPVLLHGQV